MKIFFSLLFVFSLTIIQAQEIEKKISAAFSKFESDPQLEHAISSLYVIRAVTGEVVFKKNEQVGLAGASTQKIITSATAFELLGKDYRYRTELGYEGSIDDAELKGNLYFIGSGDPTLGSWRWSSTNDSLLLTTWVNDLQKAGIKSLKGKILYDGSRFSRQIIPDGWTWQDIGNYYGAGAGPLNWKENQVDLLLRSGKDLGGSVDLLNPPYDYDNELKSAGKGTGDNAYAYLPIAPFPALVSGTIPVGENSFAISIADADPVGNLIRAFSQRIKVKLKEDNSSLVANVPKNKLKIISTYYSPSLDSIVYWFMKRSINLYGEALLKTFALEKQGRGATDSGIRIVRDFWKERGVDEKELNIYDGSGLSPLNRLTTHAQVQVLRYARGRDWFPYYLNAFPEYNGMKMKSGTIADVKGFSGYHVSKSGEEYIFSFLVNNYNGSTSSLVNKMFKVLDELK